MKKNCKYKTLKELIDAYSSGELSRDNILWIDNDDSYVHDSEGNRIFDGGIPECDLMLQALKLLNVPFEHV